MRRELDKLNSIIRDYAVTKVKPRDFNADLPILSTLGASHYDQADDLNELQFGLEKALKKFVKDWKTLDQDKISYLMKYGIVQEVMKVEERKAVRRDNQNKPKTQTPIKPKTANNQDIQQV